MKEQIEVITYEQERLNYFTDLMKKAQKRYKRLFKKFKDAPYISEEAQALSDAGRETHFLGDVVGMLEKGNREWISVEDRLPESGAHCILCCDLKCIDGTHRPYVCDGFHVERFSEQASGIDDYCITEYNEEDDEYYIIDGWYEIIKNWDDYGYIAIDDFVTHWMPLPEAPEMKGGVE